MWVERDENIGAREGVGRHHERALDRGLGRGLDTANSSTHLEEQGQGAGGGEDGGVGLGGCQGAQATDHGAQRIPIEGGGRRGMVLIRGRAIVQGLKGTVRKGYLSKEGKKGQGDKDR